MIGFISEIIYRLIYPFILIFHKQCGYSNEAIRLKKGFVEFNTDNKKDINHIDYSGHTPSQLIEQSYGEKIEEILKKFAL